MTNRSRPARRIRGLPEHSIDRQNRMGTLSTARAGAGVGVRVNGAKAPEACRTGCTRWSGSTGAPVVLVVHPYGHVWPGDAVSRIVRFLQEQRRP